MNAPYYAQLSTLLRQRYEETRPAHGDKNAPAIELIRYHLFTGANKAQALADSLAEAERTARAEEQKP